MSTTPPTIRSTPRGIASRKARLLLLGTLLLASAGCQKQPDRGANQPPATASQEQGFGYIAEDPGLRKLVGRPAPALVLKGLDGASIDLKKLYGKKPVYLKLWATYCGPCRAQMPAFEKTYETFGDRVQVIAVNAGVGDDLPKVREFVRTTGMKMPVAIDDGRLGGVLELQATPLHILIGRDGRVTYAGHQDGPMLDRAIEKLAADTSDGRHVTVQQVSDLAIVKPGDKVPVLTLQTSAGTAIELPAPSARPRALVFFGTWCESYLAKTEPETVKACRTMREFADQASRSADVEWVGVATHLWTGPQDLAAYKKSTGTHLTLALDRDGSAFRTFGINAMPAVALIDARGRLQKIVQPQHLDTLRAAVGRLSTKVQ